PGSPQQRAQRRVAQSRFVEPGEVRIAPGTIEKKGVADVIEGRAVLPGGQRAVCGSGEILQSHQFSSARGLAARSPHSEAKPGAVFNSPAVLSLSQQRRSISRAPVDRPACSNLLRNGTKARSMPSKQQR